MNSVSYMYDNICVVGFKGLSEEDAMDALIEAGLDIQDIEMNDDEVLITGDPNDLFAIKEAIASKLPNVSFDVDELTTVAQTKVTLSGDDLEVFNKLITMLESVDDIQHIYHNVEL